MEDLDGSGRGVIRCIGRKEGIEGREVLEGKELLGEEMG